MKLKGHLRFNNQDNAMFFPTLKQRVEQYFTDNNLSRNHNSTMIIKTIVMLSCYFIPFICLLTFTPNFGLSTLLWFVMGLSLAGIGMSVMHDANHDAYSANKTTNKYMGYTLNLVGGSVFNWKLQHNILHHTYTNIVHMDDDVQDKLVMRFSPHTDLKKHHRFQFIYVFMFYGILSLYWAVLKDFVQFVTYTRNGVNPNKKRKDNAIVLSKIILAKLIYFFVFLFAPAFFFHIPFWQVITGFLLMHFVAGLILTVIFQLAHAVEGTTHPLPDDKGNIENNWAIHQLNTTVNFARHNKFISWYVGGLNFQVEHHLFPRICHVHYPNIAPIVKQTAEEFGVPYLENETFGKALRSHMVTLRRFGRLPDINEALA